MTLSVEVSDLKGWSEQVNRAGGDMYTANDYAEKYLNDADFGKILELITGDYAALLPKVQTVLDADGKRLRTSGLALEYAADDYTQRDHDFASVIAKADKSLKVTDDGVANGFADIASGSSKLLIPTGGGEELPEVSFGGLFDTICDLVSTVGGPDIREEVTKILAGNLGKASLQVSAWNHLADCTETVRLNLEKGEDAISKTWSGLAATAESEYIKSWDSTLTNQKTAMQKMEGHLRDSIKAAVEMAQTVIDLVLTVISVVSAGLSAAAIPLWGQVKAIKSATEAVKTVWSAYKVIKVFKSLLKTFVDVIKLAVTTFTMESLPAEPALGV